MRSTLTPTQRIDRSISEAELESFVEECLILFRWVWHHASDSRRSTPGLPDIVAARDGRLIFAELKTEIGRVTTGQERWFAELATCEHVETYIWRPRDMNEIIEVLK